MLRECASDSAGVRTLVLTKRDVDQGKRARFSYPLGDDFFAVLKFQELVMGEDAGPEGGSAGSSDYVEVRKPGTLQETWEDD